MSVTKHKRGGRVRYDVRWWEGGRDGRHRSKTFDRREDADTFEADIRRRGQLGAYAPVVPAGQPLERFLRDEWWPRCSPLWAQSTRLQRAGIIDRWIVPYLGHLRLRDVGGEQVAEWRARVLTDGCPATQPNQAVAVLSAALGEAVRNRKLPGNPCVGVGRVPVVVARPRALTPIDVERLRRAMPTRRDALLVSLLAYAGLRPGEALALTWDSVTGHVLVIDRNWTYGELKLTKTGRRRAVDLLEPLRLDLAEHRPKLTRPGELVIRSRQGSGLLDLRAWRKRAWATACDRAGIDANPYDLRHTFASLLIHEGRPVVYVAGQMGHASSTTTLDHYAHVYADAQLAPTAQMTAAIVAARGELDRNRVRPMYVDGTVRTLRSTIRTAESRS